MSMTDAQLRRFATSLATSGDLWGHLVQHRRDARLYEQIWDTDDVNAWLICWSEDQDTGFHDHDDSAAAIRVIEGQVREERLRLGAAPSSRVIGPGSTFLVPPSAIHRVLHAGSAPAVTIHAMLCHSSNGKKESTAAMPAIDRTMTAIAPARRFPIQDSTCTTATIPIPISKKG